MIFITSLYTFFTLLMAVLIVREYPVRLERVAVLSIFTGRTRILLAARLAIVLAGLHCLRGSISHRGVNHAD